MGSESLADVVGADLCSGCGICEAISGHDRVRMEIDHKGFYRPQILQADPDAWQEIKQVCPGVGVRQEWNSNPSELETLWGPVRSARVGYSTDEQIRWQASSGGALSTLLVHLLETGKADFVVHVGVRGSDPCLASACKSYSREQVLGNAGSRYAPTAPLVDLTEMLEGEQSRFAFVGKPCDVAALRAYGKLNPRVGQRVVAYISFFCAGTPSMLATYNLVSALGVERDDLGLLRYRGHGWPGRATAVDLRGREHTMSYDDSWGKILGPTLQFRCKICPDGTGELADIAFGDAWYVKGGRPCFEERDGRSLILARTASGQHFLEEAESAGYLMTEEFDLQDLGSMQPYQKARRRAIAPRFLALRLAGKPLPRYEGFHLVRNARDAGLWSSLRQFGGMLRRVIAKRAVVSE